MIADLYIFICFLFNVIKKDRSKVDNFGNKRWINKNGALHREGRPAIERANGRKYWYLNGIQYETKESYFDALSYEVKRLCLISEDFLNA